MFEIAVLWPMGILARIAMVHVCNIQIVEVDALCQKEREKPVPVAVAVPVCSVQCQSAPAI
jgi:hypothetical protein